MCYINSKAYTVCAHAKVEGGPFVCWGDGTVEQQHGVDESGNWRVSGPSCWPLARTTELVYGFCGGCISFYRGFETRDVSAILNYWAARGYSASVPAGSISADDVFCGLDPNEDLAKRPHYELVALGIAFPPVAADARKHQGVDP